MTSRHALELEHRRLAGGGVEFRARCSCGWASVWESTNAVMGRGRRYVAHLLRGAR